MHADTTSLRKAAVLLDSLDPAVAESLLAQMAPDQERKVRQIWSELEPVDPAEQAAVIEEFVRGSGRPDERPGPQRGHQRPDFRQVRDEIVLGTSQPLLALADAGATRLRPHLEQEHPQTIAALMAHLPPDQAAEVLAGLPESLQADVVRRMSQLAQTDPDVIGEVAAALLTRVDAASERERRDAVGTEALRRVWRHAPPALRQRLAGALGEVPAVEVPPSPATWDEVARLAGNELEIVVESAGVDLFTLALAGSTREQVTDMLARLPETLADRLSRGMLQLGPTRLGDLENAQHQILAETHELARDGRIRLTDAALVAQGGR